MARPCTVCDHPEIEAINRALVDTPKRYRPIASRYGLGHKSVARHATGHMTAGLAKAIEQHAQLSEDVREMDVMATLNRCADRADRMLAAADEWLRDPVDSSRYNLNPRTHEVDIVYEREVEGRTVRETRKLRDLMEAVESGLGVSVVRGETKVADPRKLLLDAVATLKPVVELLGKASGALKVDGPSVQVVNITQHPDYQHLAQVYEEFTRINPEGGAQLAALMREAVEVKAIGGGRR